MAFRRKFTQFPVVELGSDGAIDPLSPVTSQALLLDTFEFNQTPGFSEFVPLFRKFKLLRVTWTLKLMQVIGITSTNQTVIRHDQIVPIRMRHIRIKPPGIIAGTGTFVSYGDMDQRRCSSKTFTRVGDTIKYSVPLWMNTQLSDVEDVLQTNYGLKWAPWLPTTTAGMGAAHGMAYMGWQSIPVDATATDFNRYQYSFQQEVLIDFAVTGHV